MKSEIWIDHLGVLWVKPEDSAEIDLEEARACFAVYRSLGCKENKILQLLDGRKHFTLTDEARSYAALQGKEFFIASAIISNNLAMRIAVNFFNRFMNHDVPFKMFGTERAAIDWLLKFRK